MPTQSTKMWKPLDKHDGNWLPRLNKKSKPVRIEKPTNKPCLFDDGNSRLMLSIDNSIVLTKNAFCSGDRIVFMRQVTQLCDRWLLS